MPSAAQIIRQLLALLRGGKPPRMLELPGGQMYVLVPRATQVAVDLTGPNRFLEEGRGYRSQIALELMDEDVYGFMLLMLKRGPGRPEICFRSQTEPGWREAFAASLGRVVIALDS